MKTLQHRTIGDLLICTWVARAKFLPSLLVLCLSLTSVASRAQEQAEPAAPSLSVSDFIPVPNAKFHRTEIANAKFPVVDAHSHFFHRTRHDPQQLGALIELMDRNRIAICISLDGTLGRRLDEHKEFLWTEYKDRFVIFCNIDWRGAAKEDDYQNWDCNQSDFVRRTCMQIQSAQESGVSGLKVFKSLGLEIRNADGSFTELDEPRLDPIFDTCGNLGVPVLIHTADPSAFFQPLTPNNERYEELSRHPEWHYPSNKFPTREHLFQARQRLFSKHPKTIFIAAHFANDAEDLVEAANILEAHPNVILDFASRISELGRQPFTARDFFIRHQDRIVFGTDGPWPEQRYHAYWRFLETHDEYFDYSEKPIPPQGLWRIYGIDLPDAVLRKIYYENAMRWIPGVKERLNRLNLIERIDDEH